MPRDDDDLDRDEPRRRRPRDDDDRDEPRRRSRDEQEDDEPPAKRGRDEDDFDAPRKKKKSALGLILGILAGVLFLFCAGGGVAGYFIYERVNTSADKMVSNNNLRQISLAGLNYESSNRGLPTNSYSPTGQPLLSWRVHILPYVEQDNLYRQFNLNEPWDGPTNKRLLASMPKVYATPEERKGKVAMSTKTFYRGFSSPGTLFSRGINVGPGGMRFGMGDINDIGPLPKGRSLVSITDGTSNTIFCLEAGEAIEWTKPEDLDISVGRAMPKLGGIRPSDNTVNVAFCDGSVRMIRKTNSESTWRAMATYSGGEVVPYE